MPPRLPRRLWCSCTIIGYLEGKPEAANCERIIALAKAGDLEIVVSVAAMGEVAKISGVANDEAEARIKRFFEERYVVRAAYDVRVAEKVRELVRKYSLKPTDAVHMATALLLEIPFLETFDDKLLRLTEREGNPTLVIRTPFFEEPPQRLLPLSLSGPGDRASETPVPPPPPPTASSQ